MEEATRGCEENAAWQKARELLQEVYAVSNTGQFALDFSLCERLRWSAISIVLSIADGMNSTSDDEQCRFLVIAERAAAEFLVVLSQAYERRYLTKQRWNQLRSAVNEISGMIGGCLHKACPAATAAEVPSDEPVAPSAQEVETMIVRPDLFGWCRGYSEATGLWGWKLRGFSDLN